MTTLESLWKAVKSKPKDNDAKRILADWYEEHQPEYWQEYCAGLRYCAKYDRHPSESHGFITYWKWTYKEIMEEQYRVHGFIKEAYHETTNIFHKPTTIEAYIGSLGSDILTIKEILS